MKMKKLLTALLSLLFVFAIAVGMQGSKSSTKTNNSNSTTSRRRGPIFRASADQVKQAQGILKERGFYSGAQTGKLDDDSRAGLKKYQGAEALKVTGTLNKVTLEKMNIALTDKQKSM
jgi:peptidoglycan hydrolase-like protein with peptidoglycan-binding domain